MFLENQKNIHLIFDFLIIYHHKKVVDFDNEDHNTDKDMNKHNHQVDVVYIHHHLYILLHCPNS
jgi:hypothetical protein